MPRITIYKAIMLQEKVAEKLKKRKPKSKTMSEYVLSLLDKKK